MTVADVGRSAGSAGRRAPDRPDDDADACHGTHRRRPGHRRHPARPRRRPDVIPALIARVAAAGGTLRNLSTVRRHRAGRAADRPGVEIEVEVEGLAEDALTPRSSATCRDCAARA